MIAELIRFGELVFWFLVCLPIIFYIHELCHAWSCKRQGGKPKIGLWFYKLGKIPVPSMRCSCEAGTGQSINWRDFYYAGGFGAGFIAMIFGFPFYWIYQPVFIGMFCSSTINFVYGIYEGGLRGKISDKVYMDYHYLAEIIGLIIGMILLRQMIWNWIICQ